MTAQEIVERPLIAGPIRLREWTLLERAGWHAATVPIEVANGYSLIITNGRDFRAVLLSKDPADWEEPSEAQAADSGQTQLVLEL
jgi:hypothetical protein